MLKGKKILAVLLAVIMMLSVTPMALADSPDVNEVYFNAVVRFITLKTSVYEDIGTGEKIINKIPELKTFESIKSKYHPDESIFLYGGNTIVTKYPEAAMEYAEVFNKIVDDADKYIADREIRVQINTYEIVEAYFKLVLNCDYEKLEDFIGNLPEATMEKYTERLMPYAEMLNDPNPSNYTQADYEKVAVIFVEFCNKMTNCLNNEHTYENGECDCGAKESEGMFDTLFDLLNMLFELIISIFK